MSYGHQLWLDKHSFERAQLVHVDSSVLLDGEVRLEVNNFALTANNITYAAMGFALQYWDFFPTSDVSQGIIPVWGFATVVESRHSDIPLGEKLYGYLPLAEGFVIKPGNVTALSLVDRSEHRQHLSIIYNQLMRCSADPIYKLGSEGLQMLLRPLFTTSFLLDDFFADNEFFGADQLVLSSASSKTALGMAFGLSRNRMQRGGDYRIIGLTSAANRRFVESLGCYDEVVSYDSLEKLNAGARTASIDFAGNGEVLSRIHNHFSGNLAYSCLVGASHWNQRAGMAEMAQGPAPQLFFAPSQAEKRSKEWGGQLFQSRLAELWQEFVVFVDGWLELEEHSGNDKIVELYQSVLSGELDPSKGYILSFNK
jgi:hypothetical protein